MYLLAASLVLQSLATLMESNHYSAYIVPAGDDHYTEFIAPCHQRRAFISNFTGSAGTAVVVRFANNTIKGYLWTDGRYFKQAEDQLDLNNWEIMREGMPGTPTQAEWFVSNLAPGSNVSVDPRLYTKGQWDNMQTALAAAAINLVPNENNLVDEVWTNRPSCDGGNILTLGIQYSGMATSAKVAQVREQMQANGASVLLVAELDEVAWLLNLRGRDIPTSSIFFGYVVLTANNMYFYVNDTRFDSDVRSTLETNVPGISIDLYENIYTEFRSIAVNNPSGKIWVNQNANYKLVSSVENLNRLMVQLTPISLMKAIKNEVEVAGYRRALIRDAAALCEFFAWLEPEIQSGRVVTEISAAEKLYQIRNSSSELFFDNSFTTISASGPNGAIIHYMPTEETNRVITQNDMYLLDSGGLYPDGTTDITRTIHFGQPTEFQKEAYTRVLKGHIAIANIRFPEKTVGHRVDSFAREFLWEVGLEYNHGTGHGIGSFLNVHEGPFSIGSRYSANDPGLQENMFNSNEPGYYDVDEGFGIRLENIVRVSKAEVPYNFDNRTFLEFEDLTFLPYQHKLINLDLLTDDEIAYLNDYQEKTRTIIGAYLQEHQFSQAAYDWMIRETPPITRESGGGPNAASPILVTNTIYILVTMLVMVVFY